MTAAAHEPAGASFLAAARAVLDARRAQRGEPRFGDDADGRLLQALVAMPDDGASALAARTTGCALGREVFARRVFEDSMPGCIVVLSIHLTQSGWGKLHLLEHFHRSATARFEPEPALASASNGPLRELIAGIVEGTFAEAFNCRAEARALDGFRVEVMLLEGRDVNHGGGYS